MELKKYIKNVRDFPIKGILFKDISPLLENGKALAYTINEMAKLAKDAEIIVSPDARGFLFGTPVAAKLEKPFIMVRKPGKLPGKVISAQYQLEYGTNTLEMHVNVIKPGQKVVIIDDLLATGGTVKAIIELVEKCGGIIDKIIFLINLSFLKGSKEITNKYNVEYLLEYNDPTK